jgi:putative ABC transport system substrate-binding protein
VCGGLVRANCEISETNNDPLTRRLYQPFFDLLWKLGDVEGQNLIIERYSADGRPGDYTDLAREIVARNPDVIVAVLSHWRSARPPGQSRLFGSASTRSA